MMDYLKVQKALNRVKHIRNTMDILEYENNIFSLKGWIYAENKKIDDFKLLVKTGKDKYFIPVKYGLERVDVYQFYQNENAKKSGFFGRVIIENVSDFSVYIVFQCGGHTEKMFIGKYHGTVTDENEKPVVRIWKNAENGIDLLARVKKNLEWTFQFPQEYFEKSVDIIVPVYNGYDFLETLLTTISNTQMSYQLYLIDDCSPDDRVYAYLQEYSATRGNVHLYRNERNLGFVATVNRGLKLSKNHVAIVNTDVELPRNWLERLMYPVFADDKVASATPYTNCGTNCSFPNFYEDNEMFLGLGVQQIDDEFIKMKPSYEKLPTGVGFCMGMSRNVLDEIGFFDEASFGKGYGEENDWCQRAIKKGYKNVQIENLFVYHKHGGSFLSEDKKRLIEEHENILLKKHPLYNKDISRFYTMDPNREIREFVALELILKFRQFDNIVAFDHDLGGGATAYLEGKRKDELKTGKAFTIVRYDGVDKIYKVRFYYQEHVVCFVIKGQNDLLDMLEKMSVKEIWINELVTYPALYEWMDKIIEFKERTDASLKMLIHDFYCVCPTINMLNCDEKYCNVETGNTCNQCLKNVRTLQYLRYESMEIWRGNWLRFLQKCSEVVVFSNNSREVIERAFGELEHVKVIPHVIDYIPKIEKKYKTTKTINIGLLGVLLKHKGRDIVEQMARMIERQNLNIRIILIGSTMQPITSSVFKETGEYTRDMVPRLVFENDIDVFLIPAIWPETFSYTAEEIMHMGMPVMSFDIGAPAERIKCYDKGVIIPKVSAEAILDTIIHSDLVQQCGNKSMLKKKVLFVVEDITFSSRYRVDHLREQLLYQGVESDFVLVGQCMKKRLDDYSSVVVYRSSQKKVIKSLVQKAHECGKQVYYDIDDYIFEYEQIRELDFLNDDAYTDFENYSDNIRAAMECCDGYIVSTNHLKEVLNKSKPDKPTYINRNVASMEMVTISMGVKKEKKNDEVILGYFSGTKTHNKDFERIKDDIMFIMGQNPGVKLLIGGQIDLPTEFNSMKDRIESFEFVQWKELPALIARADINLMPLEDSIFHACKSENKWMEAALVGVPTIASWNSELAGVIVSGETGYLCKDGNDWRRTLQKMIDHPELRDAIADNAKKKVLDRYTTLTLEPDVKDVLSNGSDNAIIRRQK